MLANAFVNKATPPSGEELRDALGDARLLWDQLVSDLAGEHQLVPEWHSYSRKAGWAMRLKRKDRNIVYLSPSSGAFMASFALGDKAMQAARESGLPASIIRILDEARRYAEGTAVRIDVKKAGDVAIVKKLTRAKLEN